MVMAIQSKVSTVDVLIVGAGPAGLMAANALAKAGVSIRIVDKRLVAIFLYLFHLIQYEF